MFRSNFVGNKEMAWHPGFSPALQRFSHTLTASFCFLVIFTLSIGSLITSALAADWTILIYMNGKNNLEGDAIANFEDIAAIGSTDKVNILVEIGRPLEHEELAGRLYGGWSGVRTFFVKENMKPLPELALPSGQGLPSETSDMGSPETLEKFLSWGKRQYPANRYMVIIWNHGQGWRAEMPRSGNRSPSFLGGFRAISFDEDTKSFLYNSDIAEVVATVFGASTKNTDQKLDLLGFDACLMSMIETAYGVQSSVKTLVASAELEPGAGWPYALWLSQLVKKPEMDDIHLARAVIEAYKQRYKDEQYTTLSAVNPSGFKLAGEMISRLSVELTGKLSKERANIGKVRAALRPYGSWYDPKLNLSIDLLTFLMKYRDATEDRRIRQLLSGTLEAIKGQILHNYSSERLIDEGYGGTGLAIYFPEYRATFEEDPYSAGYLKTNVNKPVAFVQNEKWADFLRAYLR